MRPHDNVEPVRIWGRITLTLLVAIFAAGALVVVRPHSPAGTVDPSPFVRPALVDAARPTRLPSSTPSSPQLEPPAEPSPAQLPRGGTQIFPDFRLVGYSGAEGSTAFGRLGVGSLDARVREIERRAKAYDGDRPVLPVLELISVVVQAHPGKDGLYRVRADPAQIQRYLDAARRHHALLLLNIQPGRADMLDEVKALGRWLKEPDVGVALDPEWEVGRGQVPGRVFGHTSAAEINGVAEYLGRVVAENRLPQKALVVHQLAPRIISKPGRIRSVDGVATVLSVDGIGARADKVATWKRLVKLLPDDVHVGFKLFFTEDARAGRLMTPEQVLALKPRPEYVLYE